jgi:hypothetical protein
MDRDVNDRICNHTWVCVAKKESIPPQYIMQCQKCKIKGTSLSCQGIERIDEIEYIKQNIEEIRWIIENKEILQEMIEMYKIKKGAKFKSFLGNTNNLQKSHSSFGSYNDNYI